LAGAQLITDRIELLSSTATIIIFANMMALNATNMDQDHHVVDTADGSVAIE
jgi:hypothetical protein